MKTPEEIAKVILEGEVVPFKGKKESFGKDDKVTFKQFHGSPSTSYLDHIKKKHPAAHAEYQKIHDQSKHTIRRTFASEIHKNGEHVGYMVNHWHQHPKSKHDEWGRDFETHHAFDKHGHNLHAKRVSLEDAARELNKESVDEGYEGKVFNNQGKKVKVYVPTKEEDIESIEGKKAKPKNIKEGALGNAPPSKRSAEFISGRAKFIADRRAANKHARSKGYRNAKDRSDWLDPDPSDNDRQAAKWDHDRDHRKNS